IHNDPDGMEHGGNEIVDSFDDMNLSESLLRGFYAYGFQKPSAVQQQGILPCIKDTEGGHGTRRLHGCLLSCLYWGHPRAC
uniref:RNA helicase n=1 Tax=Rhinopithecus bieti TaxID=61621 RepID=A0A2K6MNN8_RHIBE